MTAMLGELPSNMRKVHDKFGRAKLKNIPLYISLEQRIEQEVEMEEQEVDAFSQWLRTMLTLDPHLRATAGAAASHTFLDLGVKPAKTVARIKAYGHTTDPRLPPLDCILEDVFREVAKKGLCSGQALMKYLERQFPGYGSKWKQWKVKRALDWMMARGGLVQVISVLTLKPAGVISLLVCAILLQNLTCSLGIGKRPGRVLPAGQDKGHGREQEEPQIPVRKVAKYGILYIALYVTLKGKCCILQISVAKREI